MDEAGATDGSGWLVWGQGGLGSFLADSDHKVFANCFS